LCYCKHRSFVGETSLLSADNLAPKPLFAGVEHTLQDRIEWLRVFRIGYMLAILIEIDVADDVQSQAPRILGPRSSIIGGSAGRPSFYKLRPKG
jgi:hypothetical protein